MSAHARLLADDGAAAAEEQFFRSPQFLAAEGATHTLIVERGSDRAALPVLVREIDGAEGSHDAISPYGYPGAAVEGEPIAAEEVDWSETGLVSVFVRERLGDPPALAAPTERSLVLLSDPGLQRKSRMSDRQQIRKNAAAGLTVSQLPGPEAGEEDLAAFHRIYSETMEQVGAAERYLYPRSYFDQLFSSPLARMFVARTGEGEIAATAIAADSDGVVHYYLSGTANAHRRGAPSKNLIAAVIDDAAERGMPMNLGGGMRAGDRLEEFKRGFANSEAPFRTHEIICDPELYDRLAAGRPESGFFPLYRSP